MAPAPVVAPAPATAPPPAPTLPPATAAAPPTLLPTPAAPPVTTAALPPAAPPATTLAPVDDEAAVRKVVADYARAIETKDLALFRTLKPNLTPDDERRLREAFEGIRSQRVEMRILAVQVQGQTSTVRATRRDEINGKALSAVEQTFVLARGPAGWTIREIGR